jgi:concanavalin A-like lectin/glucanase superfamily protein/lamin tail-like protein/PA domain-containing protein/type IX secretion system substrate protein
MKKLLISLMCLSIFININGQTNELQAVNRAINFEGNTSSKTTQLNKGVATCVNDTIEYTLAKATSLQSLNINNATSAQAISQYFNASQSITVHGATFYAYKLNSTGGISLNATVELYLAGADSLPIGAALASGVVSVDTTYGGGSLPVLEKNITFSSPVTVNQSYVIVIGNSSANGMGMIFNDWTVADGSQEWLANVNIGGSWLRPYGVNVGGAIFDADVLIYPHVSYDLTADFTTNRTVFNSNPDTITFTDNSSLVLKDRMYNQAAYLGITNFSYTYDFGDGSSAVNAIDTNHIFTANQNYSVTLSDTIYGWRTNCVAQETKLISTPPIANLVITEIMYNPAESGTDSTEFIEIYNNGSTTVDLTNYTCTGGIYTFPSASIAAGAYYVITIDSSGFYNTYGFNADGVFSGGLSNSSESIVLKDAFGNLVDSVLYDDGGLWPSGTGAGAPDGGGASIIFCDLNSDNNDGTNWKACTNQTGVIIQGLEVLASPGVANTCCPVIAVTDTRSVCDSLLWIDGLTYYTDNNTATFTYVNGSGCDSVVTLDLTINASPSNQLLSASQNTFCPGGGSATIDLTSSEVGVDYYLRDDANDILIDGPLAGTGSGISLNTGNITSTTTFNVYAQSYNSTTINALEFTGNTGLKKVSLGTAIWDDNFVGQNKLTVEAWVKRSSTGSLHTIIGNYLGSYPFLFRIDNDKITFFMNSTASVPGSTTIPVGTWTHVAGTYDGTTIKVYVNGVLDGSGSYSSTFNATANELKIGGGLSTTEYFLGDIADVRLWNVVKTEAEIAAMKDELLMGSESGLVANYQFTEGSGSTTSNSVTGNAYSGTLVNNPAWVAGPIINSTACSVEMTQLITISINDATAPVPDVANLPDITGECIVDSLTAPTATDDCSGNTRLTILPPTSIAGVNTNLGLANFGPQTFNINGQCVIAQDITPDSLCCDSIINNYTGKIAVIYRGACSFEIKVKNVQASGAIGVIIVNNAGGTAVQDMAGTDTSIVIPIFMVSTDDGLALMNEINLGNVDVIMERRNPITITNNATLPITTPGTTVVTWTYDDGNGNTSTQNQNVIIPSIDNTIDNSLMPTLTANQTGASYRWLDCDNGNAIIPTETNQSFTATVNGNYAVEITVGSCVDTSACENITGVGIKEAATNVVSIYPNPTNGLFTISLAKTNQPVSYTVTTLEGRLVEQVNNVTKNNIEVDLTNESKGVYFLLIQENNTNTTYKIVRQ